MFLLTTTRNLLGGSVIALVLVVITAGCSDSDARELKRLADDQVYEVIPPGAELTLEAVSTGCLDRDSGGHEGYAIREYVINPEMHPSWRKEIAASFKSAAVGTSWTAVESPSSLARLERSDGATIDVFHANHLPDGESP